MRRAVTLAIVLLFAACASPARYERVPVPSTPYTLQKIEVSEAICREKGKTLRCETRSERGLVASDCWCDPR